MKSHKALLGKLNSNPTYYVSAKFLKDHAESMEFGLNDAKFKEELDEMSPFDSYNFACHFRTVTQGDVSYISSKKYIQSENPTYRTINWQFAFNVWGHWRIIKGTGKNRSGEYCISGKTWVIPSVKNKHLELKNNIRIVK